MCWALYRFFSLFIKKENLENFPKILALTSLWTLLEWSHLFFLSGYSFNPAGLALTGSLYPLQFASVLGIFGLSFWIILVNLSGLRAWLRLPNITPLIAWAFLAAVPYLFGVGHLALRQTEYENHVSQNAPLHVLLVQTAFPAEEALPFKNKQSYIAFVLDEWKQILEITKKHVGKQIDLIVLPE